MWTPFQQPSLLLDRHIPIELSGAGNIPPVGTKSCWIAWFVGQYLSRNREHSSPYALDDREVSFGGNDAPKPEPGSLQQLPELRLSALSATRREH